MGQAKRFCVLLLAICMVFTTACYTLVFAEDTISITSENRSDSDSGNQVETSEPGAEAEDPVPLPSGNIEEPSPKQDGGDVIVPENEGQAEASTEPTEATEPTNEDVDTEAVDDEAIEEAIEENPEELSIQEVKPEAKAALSVTATGDNAVATIGSTEYESLTDAIAAAKSGDTIKLLKNVKGYFPIENKNITIDLNGKTVTAGESDTIISNRNLIRAFQVTSANVTIKNGTITGANAGGYISAYDSTDKVYKFTYWGGVASAFNGASITLDGLTITENSGTLIMALDNTALNIRNCKIVNNNGDSNIGNAYGLIYTAKSWTKVTGATLNVTNTEISGMTGTKGAAPVYIEGGSATLTGCNIKNNKALYAGGIYFAPVDASAKLTLNDTTVSGNTGYNASTSRKDSGIGGLYLSAGTVELINSAIYNNVSASTLLSAGDIVLSGNSTASLIAANEMVDHGAKLEGYVYRNGVSGEVLKDGIPSGTHTGGYSTTPKDQFDVLKLTDTDGAWEYGNNTYDSLTDAANAYIADNGAGGEIKLLKDITENDTLPAIGTSSNPAVVNLNGKTVQSLTKQQTTINLSGKSYITFKDGTIKDGRIGVDVKTIGSELTVNNVTFKDNVHNGINAGTTATTANLTILKMDGCTFEGNGFGGLASLSGSEVERNSAYAVNWKGHFDISDTTFTGNNGGLTFSDPSTTTPSTLSKVTFTKNKWICFNAGSGSIATSYQKPVTLTDCDFIENEPTGGYVIYFYVPSKALKFTNCNIKNNSGSIKTIYLQSGYTVMFSGCEISGNKAEGISESGFPVAGIHSVLTGTISYPLNLYNCIIKDNAATTEYASVEGSNYYPTGGVYANSTLKVNGTASAIYNNRGASTSTPNMVANDIYLVKSKNQQVPAADKMVDGEFDFTNYVWVNAKETDPITAALSGAKADARLLTAEPYKELNVARIGETEYKTLEDAFAAASDGDLIEVIIREQRPFVKNMQVPSIVVDKKVTLDINGMILESDDDTQFVIKNGGKLTIKDSLSDYNEENGGIWRTGAVYQYITSDRNKIGAINKKMVIEEGGSLAIESTIVAPEIDHQGDSLYLDKVLIGTKRTAATDNGIFITLGKDRYVELGDAWEPVTTKDMWEPRITFTLDQGLLADLNDESKAMDDVVITKGNVERIILEGQTKINGLTADNVRRVYTKSIPDGADATIGGFVLRKDAGYIYLDEVDGKDKAQGADGNINNPYRTFEEAKIELEKNEDFGGIIVKNVATVDSTETWDLSSCEERGNLFRWEEYTGNLIRVTGTGSLTLTNITVDGKGVVSGEGLTPGDGSLIYVEPRGTLTLGIGSVLRNNHIQNINANTSCGGAVYSAGELFIQGASLKTSPARLRLAADSAAGTTITDNSAIQGGGIYQVGKVPGNETDYTGRIIMTGGTVAHNIATHHEGHKQASQMPAGGGIMLAYGADMCFSGGSVNNNISTHIGGGISLGTTGDATSTCLVKSGTTTLSMYDSALISGNKANGEGGGIYVQINTKAYITEGTISNNRAAGSWPYNSEADVPEPGKGVAARDWSHCGGGIYVNGCSTSYYSKNIKSLSEDNYADYTPGTLYLSDAEIAYNKTNTTSSRGGSAIAFCATGEANLFELHGGVIHDNDDYHGVDVYMTAVDHQTGATLEKQLDDLTYYVTQYASDGTPYNWQIVDIDPVTKRFTGEVNSVTDASKIQGNNLRLALRTALSINDIDKKTKEPIIQEAIDNAKVHIVNNTATYRGAGIGSNGMVISGVEVPKIDVAVKKEWDDTTFKSERPETVKLILQRKAEGEEDSKYENLMTKVINGEEDNWKATFADLPAYKEYTGSSMSGPSPCTDCQNGSDDKDVKWVYRVIEDGDYKPLNDDSVIWKGEDDNTSKKISDIYAIDVKAEDDTSRDGPSGYTFDDGKITIKNFTVTNKLKSGDLKVSKTVTGSDADTSKTFEYNVTLDTTVLNGLKLNGTFGDMTFKDNTATFTLKGGESKTAKGIPAGVKYTVEEKNYTSEGWELTSKTGDTGTIEENKTTSASFTNNKDKKLEESETISVKLYKVWDDYDDSDSKRPEDISVDLLGDGVKVGAATLSEETGWEYSFDNLDKYDSDGNEINYDLDENAVRWYMQALDYETTETGTKEIGFTLTNIHRPWFPEIPSTPGETGSFTVKKTVSGSAEADKKFPIKIKMTYPDGREYEQDIELSSKDNPYEFDYIDDGTKIEISETADGYTMTCKVNGEEKKEFTIVKRTTIEVVVNNDKPVATTTTTTKSNTPKTGDGTDPWSMLMGVCISGFGTIVAAVRLNKKKKEA